MAHVETLAEVVDRLTAEGYTVDFRTLAEGILQAAGTDCRHAPEDLMVDRTHRFEGVSDPDEQAILFALHCPEHGTKGTYTTTYGPMMAPADAEAVRRLGNRRR